MMFGLRKLRAFEHVPWAMAMAIANESLHYNPTFIAKHLMSLLDCGKCLRKKLWVS